MKLSKHQLEMQALRKYHDKVMNNPVLRQEILISTGVFERKADGTLAVTQKYEAIFK